MRRTAWGPVEVGPGLGGRGEGSADMVWQYARAVQYECRGRHRLLLASKDALACTIHMGAHTVHQISTASATAVMWFG